ncbi:glucokinase [Leptolyngbya sp. 'hensonii']|uniref:glucokinase n=1 Tax=Leptolyngbya sp. 'hensonii' TaxID=1922337 RepID=UPI00094F887C|nr:glucokinase [Leptolyngbya sp. 'hensonii']OLP20128.1 glucokinase [Leptolyngbya sp. 'hensonii']
MTVLLAGDIGGTKTILRLIKADAIQPGKLFPELTTLHRQTYPSREFPDLVPLVKQFLAEAETRLGETLQPERACFGIAGPVVDQTSKLTNLSWFLTSDRLERELQISQVQLINDFMAVGYGILGLTPADLCTLQMGQPNPQAPIAVIGAGTGLGQGFLVPLPGGYRVFPTEGGHADFAPRSELEFQLMHYLLEKHNITRVSVERVVSGQGIVPIYEFLRDREVAPESPELMEVFRTWKREIGEEEKTVDPAAAISRVAMAGQDYLCQRTMEIFLEAYGAEAGNLALKLLPYGGLYVAGGIAAKILTLIQQGGFLASFLHKGRLTPLLQEIPVHVVLNPEVGLLGAALYAAQPVA